MAQIPWVWDWTPRRNRPTHWLLGRPPGSNRAPQQKAGGGGPNNRLACNLSTLQCSNASARLEMLIPLRKRPLNASFSRWTWEGLTPALIRAASACREAAFSLARISSRLLDFLTIMAFAWVRVRQSFPSVNWGI